MNGMRRDVAIVLSGGGMNGVLMELGFLQRLRDSPLWPRVGWIFGTSAGALAGTLAALDRLDDLERFLLELQPEETFRPNRLWTLPLLGLHEYALPKTIASRFGGLEELARDLCEAEIELVVCATDATPADETLDVRYYELVYSSRHTEPAELAQAVLASAAISALVLPVRVGDRIATDGAWVRNYPLAHAYRRPGVRQIVAFRYVPRYPAIGASGLRRLRERLERFETARFPFRHYRAIPRITVRGSVEEVSLEPGFRDQRPWTVEAKRELIERGYALADAELRSADADEIAATG